MISGRGLLVTVTLAAAGVACGVRVGIMVGLAVWVAPGAGLVADGLAGTGVLVVEKVAVVIWAQPLRIWLSASEPKPTVESRRKWRRDLEKRLVNIYEPSLSRVGHHF